MVISIRNSLLSLLAFLTLQVRGDFKMTVTRGNPVSYSSSQISNLPWKKCVLKCLEDSQCIVAYQFNIDTTCQLFSIGVIQTAKRVSSGNMLGLKVWTNSTTCPTDITSGGQSGYTLDPSTMKTYTVTYNDPQWTFKKSATMSCPKDFSLFMRSSSPWCLQVVNMNGCFAQEESAGKCQNDYNGVLSEPEGSEENDFLMEKSTAIRKKLTGYTVLGVWISANCRVFLIDSDSSYRSQTVPCSSTNTTSTCFGAFLCGISPTSDE